MVRSRFGVTIDGPGVQPESVRLRDLAEVLQLVEAALADTARVMGVTDSDELSLSLVGVAPGSTACHVAASDSMIQAAAVVTRSLAANDFNTLPPGSQALGSDEIQAGLKDILLGPAKLYERLRGLRATAG